MIGPQGAYFHPSRIGGDGYRIRSEVQFGKFGEYDFPNLEALAARYPILPQAHTARLRIWKRSSIRGYACWAQNPTGHRPGLLTGFRNHYRSAPVYYVHEGGINPTSFNVANIFTEDQYKDIISNNIERFADATSAPYWDKNDSKDKERMSLHTEYVWPWGDKDDLGWEWSSDDFGSFDEFYKNWLYGYIMNRTWRLFLAGVLLGIMRKEDNTTQDWVALQASIGSDSGVKPSEQDWDRNCIVSYADSNYYATVQSRDYFCGKCFLRNRGWKVQGLGYPGTNVKEP